MKIINLTASPSGSYMNVWSCSCTEPPNGCAELPNEYAELFNSMKGFVNLTVVNGVITGMMANQTAYDAALPSPTVDELKANALSRIDGKCSGAIYSGIDYENKHYSLTPTAQQNITNAVAKVQAGATSVPFAADGEELSAYTAAQITAKAQKPTTGGR